MQKMAELFGSEIQSLGRIKMLGEMHSTEAGSSKGKTDNAKYVQKISQ